MAEVPLEHALKQAARLHRAAAPVWFGSITAMRSNAVQSIAVFLVLDMMNLIQKTLRVFKFPVGFIVFTKLPGWTVHNMLLLY